MPDCFQFEVRGNDSINKLSFNPLNFKNLKKHRREAIHILLLLLL